LQPDILNLSEASENGSSQAEKAEIDARGLSLVQTPQAAGCPQSRPAPFCGSPPGDAWACDAENCNLKL